MQNANNPKRVFATSINRDFAHFIQSSDKFYPEAGSLSLPRGHLCIGYRLHAGGVSLHYALFAVPSDEGVEGCSHAGGVSLPYALFVFPSDEGVEGCPHVCGVIFAAP